MLALHGAKSKTVPKWYDKVKELLVNLGAGPYDKPGWVNVDISIASGINCVYDCRKSLLFPNESVKGIFSEHFFEYIDYVEEVPDFLPEYYRVLEVGGVIRIIVSDAEKYLFAYCKEGWEELGKLRPLDSEHIGLHFDFKYSTKMELINFVFRQKYEHKFAYDYETLELLLYKYGFSSVQKQEFGKLLLNELWVVLNK